MTTTFRRRLADEIRAVALTTLYFAAWIGALMVLKALVLAEYGIGFREWSLAIVGALILAKVVLVLEHVPLGALTRHRPAWFEVLLRTAMYAAGVAVVLLLEKAVEGRHEYGGFGRAVRRVLQHEEVHHVWANAIGLSGALLTYNALAVIRRHLGRGGLLRLFLSPPPNGRSID